MADTAKVKSSFNDVMARRFSRTFQRAAQGLSAEDIAQSGARDAFFAPVDALAADVQAKGGAFLSFGHYDYLGVSGHPAVIEAGVAALRQFGAGAGASRLVGGERLAHRALEQAMAGFLGAEATLMMISGYLANLSLIPHLLTAQDLLIIDSLAHNSIASTARTGGYDCRTFAHNDCDALERILEAERGNYRQVLIVTEGLFSMDGDIPDLPRLLAMKERHDAWLMLDEAHSYGVLGATGRGITEHFGIDPRRIDISVGTLSKSFGASGGFIAAAAHVIEWLRYTLPGFVFSVGLSPATVATVRAALELLVAEPERLDRLRETSAYFLRRARDAGLNTGPAIGIAVVPVLFDSTAQTMRMAKRLRDAGIYAPPVAQVGVPVDSPRIRFFLTANHTRADIDRVIGLLAQPD
ncbi:MAG: aminotransferase class I/II-fold pyridoxal phosphate-dependent enzyme [Rhodobacteraceae bacterium]|jgi:8-amino-7-oxononanoate synthase|nr:aminotransferase class I/II-fold pyridoxal phosphate-dependent enzyme [Paracoccaceae bacterium]